MALQCRFAAVVEQLPIQLKGNGQQLSYDEAYQRPQNSLFKLVLREPCWKRKQNWTEMDL